MRLLLILFSACLLLTACRATPGGAADQRPVAPASPAPTETSRTAEPDAGTPVFEEADRQLVIWAPDFFSRTRENAADRTIDAALTQFEQNHPHVIVEIQPKALTGQAGALSYMTSAQRVAPDILPDIVLLNTSELWQAADLGLISPLTERERVLLGDFYPFARQAVAYNDQEWGLPYFADVVHLALQQPAVQRAPRTWADLLASGHSYLFPVDSRDGYANESLLIQYVGAGGQLSEDGTLTNPDALEAVFEFYVEGQAQGIIPVQDEGYASLASVWTNFVEGDADLADTSATIMLGSDDPAEIGYEFVPTLNGTPTTLAETWVFAVLARQPEQRALATELMVALLEPSVHGEWSQLIDRLPTQPAAFELWSSSNDYYAFLRNEVIPTAVSQPNGRLYEEFSVRMQVALRSVLNGSQTPAEAVLGVRAGP